MEEGRGLGAGQSKVAVQIDRVMNSLLLSRTIGGEGPHHVHSIK